MLIVAIVAFVWVGLTSSLGVMAVDDFDSHFQGYELVYHRQYHLLLAMHEDKCYFVYTPESKEHTLDHGTGHTLFSPLHYTEISLLRHIQKNKNGEVVPSTLEAVRNKYQDLFADYHCINKRIFEVDYFHANNNTGSHVHAGSCHGRHRGIYEDPANCRGFIVCTIWGGSFHQLCAPGTAFLATAKRCEHIRQVPNCH